MFHVWGVASGGGMSVEWCSMSVGVGGVTRREACLWGLAGSSIGRHVCGDGTSVCQGVACLDGCGKPVGGSTSVGVTLVLASLMS